ncbi:MAG TPA: flagellar hook-associated protein FlgK [Armatimonadota bacterium]|jgi:flagellar hook-associated protein 1 FlgK
MPSTFGAINVGLSGLQTQRSVLDTAGHNVTNVNTPGYHRQQAVLASVDALEGAGARVELVSRVQEGFLAPQYYGAQGSIGQQDASLGYLQQVQAAFGEPSETGLANALDQFFNSFQELSAQPTSTGARAQVIAKSGDVASRIQDAYGTIRGLTKDVQTDIGGALDSFNKMASQVAELNQAIMGSGDQPNDLLDKRDGLLKDMASIAPITVKEGGLLVTVAGRAVVQGDKATKLVLGASGTATPTEGAVAVAPGELSGGKLAGLVAQRDQVIPQVLAQMDGLANALRTAANSLQASGFGMDGTAGPALFTGTGALDLQVNAELVKDPSRLAASATGSRGDGSNALKMADLRDAKLLGTQTLGDAYGGLVADQGSRVEVAQSTLAQSTLKLKQIDNESSSLTGVSLDEEAATIMQSQQAFNASAKFISVSDAMLSSLLAMIG